MKIIDWYIINKYLATFMVMIGLFIPIGVMIDMAEKIDKIKENEVPTKAIISYYIDFTWYFGNLLFPIFLFLARPGPSFCLLFGRGDADSCGGGAKL